ncbi:hypothetical protein RJZ57_005724 [Blastomyces gilchristii]
MTRNSGIGAPRKSSNSSTSSGGNHTALELLQRRQYAHEKLRRLVIKAAGIFKDIEKWDDEAPVGMGGEASAFLEGFLEEVLVRVEPEEETGVGVSPVRVSTSEGGDGATTRKR